MLLLDSAQPAGHLLDSDVVDVKHDLDGNCHLRQVLWHNLQHLLHYLGVDDIVTKETRSGTSPVMWFMKYFVSFAFFQTKMLNSRRSCCALILCTRWTLTWICLITSHGVVVVHLSRRSANMSGGTDAGNERQAIVAVDNLLAFL